MADIEDIFQRLSSPSYEERTKYLESLEWFNGLTKFQQKIVTSGDVDNWKLTKLICDNKIPDDKFIHEMASPCGNFYEVTASDTMTWMRIRVAFIDKIWIVFIRSVGIFTVPSKHHFDETPTMNDISEIIKHYNRGMELGDGTSLAFCYYLMTNKSILPRWVDVEPIRYKLIGLKE